MLHHVRGFGEVGSPEFNEALRFKEDSLVTTELGMKSQWLDRDLTFNISAYNDDNFTNTTLVEGKVALQYKDLKKEDLVLKPNENAFFNKQSKKLEIKKVNTYNYTAWIKGRFVFERENLDNIMTKLSRWYDVKVFYFIIVIYIYYYN